jgi:cellulose synthase/poly-beta-1,6-N-acetylglucosamine synthase-like glycosyltransferase
LLVEMSPANPVVASVIVVIDYKAGGREAWDNLRLTLKALRGQDYREPVEFLLVEADDGKRVPDDLQQILPGLRVVRTPGKTSYDFKNAGAAAAASDFVVLLDADCVPRPGWWRALIEHRRQHPEAAAISGRTLYRAQGLLPRILALIDRSYVECGEPGRTRAVSNNNCAFRRDVLLRYPLQNELGPFGSKGHVDQILAAGFELRFEPGMRVEHGYGGWPMAKADRRQIGFAMTRYRQLHHDSSHAWMFKLGVMGLPLVLAMSIAGTWKRCLRHASHYGLRWFEVPVALAAAVPAHVLEVPGILLALRGGNIEAAGAYR